MAGGSRRYHSRIFACLFAISLSSYIIGFVSSVPCKSSNFGFLLLQCNANKTRSIVHFMKTKCNPQETGSHFPAPIEGLPCECPPGKGIKIQTSPTFLWKCVTCASGNYSLGGLLIDTWERWYGSLKVPGSGYKFTPFCSSIADNDGCIGWQPSPDFSHLVSSVFVNATDPTTCYHRKSMQTFMSFYNTGEGSNYISFRYKVDGMPCPRRLTTRKACRKGLRFYVDDKMVMHSESQFIWRVFKFNLTAGTHVFRWTHLSSCSTKAGNLDVGYITHVAFVGVGKASTDCNPCPSGTFSNQPGSTECTKCPYGQFQNKSGQTSCSTCPDGYFSHSADKGCFQLKKCTHSDYRINLDPVSKCYLEGGKVVRKQHASLPSWPGMKIGPCIPEKQPDKTTSCSCQPGYHLVANHRYGKQDIYECISCPRGYVSDNDTTACHQCAHGFAAVPGLFFSHWVNVPKAFVSECSGPLCGKGGGWLAAGNSLTTQRIPGNFESYVMLNNLKINYYKAYVKFSCSVDCRINPTTNEMAKAADCFLRFSVIRDNTTVIREVDCTKYGRDSMRNGTAMNHFYMLTTQGNYSIKWLFHQNDDEKSKVLSYQASIYNISVLGVAKGSTPKCIKCFMGTEVSKDGSSCVKCPFGRYSIDGTDCKICPDNSFQDKIGSRKCVPCGANTKVNANRTGCSINKCKFQAAPGILYDLMPLANVGGSMTMVKQISKKPAHAWYHNYFYLNLCTVDHDNSSCTDLQSRKKESGTYVRESVVLKTMACKRWSLSSRYSYSLGRVMGFTKMKQASAGLIVELTDGYNCYNKYTQKMQSAKTVITMQCDLDTGIGVPMPASNTTSAVEVKPCEFHIIWRSLYACPICHNGTYEEFHTDCVNGKKNVTYKAKGLFNCRNSTDPMHRKRHGTKFFVPCPQNLSSLLSKAVSHTGLIVIIVIFILVAFGLIVTVIMLLRKNRLYRAQLFSPGTHMKQLRDDDMSELIDD